MDNRNGERLRFDDFIDEYNKGVEVKLKMNNLKKCFCEAKKTNTKFIGVSVVTPASEELIVIKNKDFDNKLSYYKKAYNEDLKLLNNKKVYIRAFTHANTLNEIGYDLF